MVLIHDARIPDEYLNALKRIFPKMLLLPFGPDQIEGDKVYSSIECHPDIYFFQYDSNKLICSPNVSAKYLEILANNGVSFLKGDRSPCGNYPDTVLYNSVKVGNSLICNASNTDNQIMNFAEEHELNIIDVKQGYARCSVVPVGKEYIITSDRAIAGACRNNDIDVLVIEPGSIFLPGEDYGFLGGSCGCLGKNGIIFLGDIYKHPDGRRVVDYAKSKDQDIICVNDLDLYDAGSLMFCE